MYSHPQLLLYGQNFLLDFLIMLTFFAAAATTVAVALLIYVNEHRGSADLVSFSLARLTFHILPETFPKNDSSDPHVWRARHSSMCISLKGNLPISSIDLYHDGVVEGDHRHIRIYNGHNPAADGTQRDVQIFFYGGGFVVGSVHDNDPLLRTLAQLTNFVVVGVEYSLAPEHTYPRAFNDAFAALRWVQSNIDAYGGNPDRIFVSGESAGGNLAAGVTARNLDTHYVSVEDRVNIIGTLLVYPGTSGNYSLDSYVKYANFNGILTTEKVRYILGLYRGGVHYGPEEYTLFPMYIPSNILAQFPPTEFVVAEHDVLRDDSLLLVERMRAAAAPVSMTLYPHTIHGFFGRDLFPEGHSSVVKASQKLLEMAARHV